MYSIKSITLRHHDSGYGGYPYKVVVRVDIVDQAAFKKLKGDYGPLVCDVNNELYSLNNLIPAHHPSIDSLGAGRFKNGVRTMIWEYFISDAKRGQALGMPGFTKKNGDFHGRIGQSVDLLPAKAVRAIAS